MYPITLLAALTFLTLPLTVLSSPIGDTVIPVDNLGVYYCTGPNWTGGCGWTMTSGGACHEIDNPSGTSFSFGPDQYLDCKIFQSANCGGGGVTLGGIYKPGYPDVSVLVRPGEVDTFRSYRCQLTGGP